MNADQTRMHVAIIDSDESFRNLTAAFIERLGHSVHTFDDTLNAAPGSIPQLDLLMLNVACMCDDVPDPAGRLRGSDSPGPPRTLLVADRRANVPAAEISPRMVLGTLVRPFLYSDLYRLLTTISYSRDSCPGRIMPFCDFHYAHNVPRVECEGGSVPLCGLESFVNCPHYDAMCAKRLQRWIAAFSP